MRGLQLETPFVFAPTLAGDFESALKAGVLNNEELVDLLERMGIPPDVFSDIIYGAALPRLPVPTTPVAVVQPAENHPGVGIMPELMLTYRNFGRVEFMGLEAAANVAVDERASIFGSLSLVSDGFFDHKEVGEENPDLFVSLNASTFKTAAGGSYTVPRGPSFSVTGRYTQGFKCEQDPSTAGLTITSSSISAPAMTSPGSCLDFGSTSPSKTSSTTDTANLSAHRRWAVSAWLD